MVGRNIIGGRGIVPIIANSQSLFLLIDTMYHHLPIDVMIYIFMVSATVSWELLVGRTSPSLSMGEKKNL